MTDIINDNGAYIDRLNIAVHTVEMPGGKPTSTLAMVIDGGLLVDLAELRREVERLNWSVGENGQLVHQVFALQERYQHTSWGADGAQAFYLLEIAQWLGTAAGGGIIGGYAYDRLKGIMTRIQHAKGPAWKPPELNALIANQRAQQMVAASFKDVDLSQLKVDATTIADGKATVVMRAGDGSTFTVQPSLSDYGAIGTITRVYPDAQ
ncbi:hypothetical protein CRM90_28420 [Mycobacterium sp. ENV421]|uniref:hypothetical protein n=1 Tax=Mycobacterium sp. ENV421 TaxID=1213407 RepID=UPI000C9A6E0B|nr:hypothetical protein [Mycobacterium sp. ENV421]PND54340.1 hypothetical protein CRM90_28420 [Mycobacterium sp. ENV421]